MASPPFDHKPPRGYEAKGLTEALRLLNARKGPPTEADVPPVSVLPHTPASREALKMAREHGALFEAVRHRVVNRGGNITRERASEAGSEGAGDSTTGPVSLAAPAAGSNVVPIGVAKRR